MAGSALPRPTYVPLDAPFPIIEWMLDTLRRGETPHLKTYASSAVRLCQVALARGIDLTGVRFTVTGEPVTEARLATIRRTGARATPRCGASETGLIGIGCLKPEACDELHLFQDLNAVIQPGSWKLDALTPRALLVTTLRPTARMVLLNASLGDEATLGPRACGCPMEQLGWTVHLHSIRSPEKLTAAGMTLRDVDVERVLERVLPGRFGGGPTDYQLVEDVAPDGRSRLRLFVHPAVGPLDVRQVAATFLAAIGPGSGVERVMSLLWREAGVVNVERRVPMVTPAGKILHLHQERDGRPESPSRDCGTLRPERRRSSVSLTRPRLRGRATPPTPSPSAWSAGRRRARAAPRGRPRTWRRARRAPRRAWPGRGGPPAGRRILPRATRTSCRATA